jgi:hypothetical protein
MAIGTAKNADTVARNRVLDRGDDRFVEAKLLADIGDRLRRRALAQIVLGKVAGKQFDANEQQGRDCQDQHETDAHPLQ